MADTSRFPEGVLLQSSLSVARPVGTLVLNNGSLYYSTNASVATYALVTGSAPVASTLSRTLNVQTADSTTLNAGTGSGLQSFSTTYTIPASTVAAGDSLRIVHGGSYTQVANFDLSLALSIQGTNRGSASVSGVLASGQFQVVTDITFDSGGGGLNARYSTNFYIANTLAATFYDDQGYTFASTGLIQLSTSLSGGNAGNTITQKFRSVELIKASS